MGAPEDAEVSDGWTTEPPWTDGVDPWPEGAEVPPRRSHARFGTDMPEAPELGDV